LDEGQGHRNGFENGGDSKNLTTFEPVVQTLTYSRPNPKIWLRKVSMSSCVPPEFQILSFPLTQIQDLSEPSFW